MCYIAMFPQLVAGPIVRYNTIADQLHARNAHRLGKFYQRRPRLPGRVW